MPPPSSLQKHIALDAALRNARVPLPHTRTSHDVAGRDLAATLSVADSWVSRCMSG